MPKDAPWYVYNVADVAFDGLAHCAHQANGKHANRKAEKRPKDDLLMKSDIDFPEQTDGNCDDCGAIISIAVNTCENFLYELRRSVSIFKALSSCVMMIVLRNPAPWVHPSGHHLSM